MLGRLPWFAFERRRRALRFLVFFDIGTLRYGGSAAIPLDAARPLRLTAAPMASIAQEAWLNSRLDELVGSPTPVLSVTVYQASVRAAVMGCIHSPIVCQPGTPGTTAEIGQRERATKSVGVTTPIRHLVHGGDDCILCRRT